MTMSGMDGVVRERFFVVIKQHIRQKNIPVL